MSSGLKYGLPPGVVSGVKSILRKFTSSDVILYGSRAIGTFKNGSDIDLVIMDPKLTTSDLLKIETELEDLMIPYKIDLCLFSQLESMSLKEHILRVGVFF